MSVPARAYLSIGEVLTKLRGDFADITISKIRFLESEGLIDPQRTPSGYRKFTGTDLERLRYVLLAQRDQYLPLRVIKENLDALDRGLQPAATSGAVATPRLATVDGEMAPAAFGESSEMRLSRDELLKSSGLTLHPVVATMTGMRSLLRVQLPRWALLELNPAICVPLSQLQIVKSD